MHNTKHLKHPLTWCAAALALAGGLATQQSHAASHREAPFITTIPKVDGTDFYMFRSYEPGRQDFVTFIANYQPFQSAYGGPNFFTLDPNALYEIHVDSDGDAKEDLTFQFRFKVEQRDIALDIGGKSIAVPLVNVGQITQPDPGASILNVRETYTINAVRDGRRNTGKRQAVTHATSGASEFVKPVDNIGAKSIPNYAQYAAQHVYPINIPGCAQQGKVFVGQRKEPFYVNLGEAFDLINLNPLGPRNAKPNILDDDNITSLALEVPIACLTKGSDPVIGAWTTASLRQARLLDPTPRATSDGASREGGAWTQVSRLGMPLVNELVIGLKDKNKFNHSKPSNDAQFLDYVTNPTLPALIQVLFNVPAPATPRNDLVTAFLTGVPNVNKPARGVPAEMLRLNTALPATSAALQNDLGALQCFANGALTLTNPGCDPAGFPNGRRPIDDVTDITLRVAEGILIPGHLAAIENVNDGTQLPGAAAGAGASQDFATNFPYLNTPISASPAN